MKKKENLPRVTFKRIKADNTIIALKTALVVAHACIASVEPLFWHLFYLQHSKLLTKRLCIPNTKEASSPQKAFSVIQTIT